MMCIRGQLRAFNILWIGAALLAGGSGCASSPPAAARVAVSTEPAAPLRKYELRIDSVPTRSEVVIDGEPAGTTPVVRRYDHPTAVVVEVTAPGHAPAVLRTDEDWWLRSAAASAADRLGRNVVVRSFRPKLEPVVLLEFVSDPAGGSVTINGELYGQTPLSVQWDGAKPLSVRVARPHHAQFTTTLDGRWWQAYEQEARLDTSAGAYTATVSAKLFPSNSTKWTRVAYTSKGSKGKDKRGKNRGSRGRSGGQTLEIAGPTLTGGRFDLSQYRGKVVLVDFWASWCGPCRAEAPNVLNVYQRYHKDGFEVVGVSLDKSKGDLQRFVRQLEIPWPQIFFDQPGSRGWDNPLARKYKIKSIPSTYLIGRDGKVAEQGVRGTALAPAVAKLLK